jgi:hypothetical protein
MAHVPGIIAFRKVKNPKSVIDKRMDYQQPITDAFGEGQNYFALKVFVVKTYFVIH